jgi:hypothetical protein
MKKEGFADKELTVTGTVSGWYIGDILFGGAIGMLAVDPVTGAMYTLPDAVTGALEPSTAKTSSRPPESVDTLTIVSTESLTPEQMKVARLVVAPR